MTFTYVLFERLTPASWSLPTPDPVCPAVPLVRHLLHDEVALVAGVPRNVPVQMDRALVALLRISTVGETWENIVFKNFLGKN